MRRALIETDCNCGFGAAGGVPFAADTGFDVQMGKIMDEKKLFAGINQMVIPPLPRETLQERVAREIKEAEGSVDELLSEMIEEIRFSFDDPLEIMEKVVKPTIRKLLSFPRIPL